MAPPQHVKIISGAASAALLVMGIRDLIAPGSKIPFFPSSEHKRQGFFWGTKNPDELVPGQKAYSRFTGIQVITVALAKLTALFSLATEGTFLRRNIFMAIGGSQLLGSLVLVAGESEEKAKAAGASFWPQAILLGGEGLLLLYDALMRDRPTKLK